MPVKYLSPVDASFLRMESLRSPMHVGGLMTFYLPKDAPKDFLRDLLAQMRSQPFMPEPFGCKLADGWMSGLAPAWVPCKFDIDYHIRHSALPYPGGERELGVLVSRLHSHPLDMSRPLWEAHLIEGLENNRFALYFKAHHCAVDGMGAMKMVRSWLSEDPNDMTGPLPLEIAARHREPEPKKSLLKRSASFAARQRKIVAELVDTFSKLGEGGEDSTIRLARKTPRTLFNQSTGQQRRLGTQILELSRIKAIGKATGTSVNDVALAIISGAVRRYLEERDALPEQSLTASVPIAIPRTDDKPGNAVTGFVCTLATNLEDPYKRLMAIHAVSKRTKEQMLKASPDALENFALLGLSPLILGQMAGMLSKLPPFFNFVVSNVVLTKEKLYLKGAELEAMYPVSFLFDGYALNVTIVGYADSVAIGFIGCRDAIPSLQKLAVYTTDALKELETGVQAALAPKKPRRTK